MLKRELGIPGLVGISTGTALVALVSLSYALISTPSQPGSHLKGFNNATLLELFKGWRIYRRNKISLETSIREYYALESPLKDVRLVVTGTTSGLGTGIAAHLLSLGAELILPCRRVPEKFVSSLISSSIRLSEKYNKRSAGFSEKSVEERISLVEMDLSDLESVKAAANEIQCKFGKIDGLVNNAGLVNLQGSTTVQGIELSLGVNAIGAALFTELLVKEQVLRSKGDMKANGKLYNPRILSISSESHRRSPPLDLTVSLPKQPICKTTSISLMMDRYGLSKFVQCSYFLSLSLQERMENITICDMCPGAVASQISSKFNGILGPIGKAVSLLMRSGIFGFLKPEVAALPMVRFLVEDSPQELGGDHWFRAEKVPAREDVYYVATRRYVQKEVLQILVPYLEKKTQMF